MVQILPRDTRYSELAESFGPLGEGLGALTGGLIGNKLSQVRSRNALLAAGLDKKRAEAYSRLPSNVRNHSLAEIWERQGFQPSQEEPVEQREQPQSLRFQPQTNQRIAALQAIDRSSRAQQQAPRSPILQGANQGINQFNEAQAQQMQGGPRGQLEGSLNGLQALARAQQSGALGYAPQQQQLAQQQANQPQRQLGQAPTLGATGGVSPMLPSESPRIASQNQYSQQAPVTSSNPLSGPSPKFRAQIDRERRAQRDLELKEIEAQRKEAKDRFTREEAENGRAWEFNKEELKKIRERVSEGRESKESYKHLIKLAESGDIRSRGAQTLMDKLGLGHLGQNETTQLAVKEIARLAQGAGSSGLRGARGLTNYLEQTFQRSLPTLYNTPEGIVAISKLNLLNIEKNEILDNARQTVMRQNDNRIPFDLIDQINDTAEPQIQRLYENAIDDIDRGLQIPNQQRFGESKTTTLPSESSLGGFLGTVPRALEEVAGIPGNIAAGTASLGRHLLTGNESLSGRALKAVEDYAPTSEAIRNNITKPLTGEYFEPKTPAQELAQGFASTTAGIASGGGTLKNALKLAAAGTATQQAASALGFGQLGQGLAKAATILTGSMYGGRSQIQAIEKQAYNTAREVAGKVREPARELSNSYNNLAKSVKNAAMDSSEQGEVSNIINSIKRNVSSGKNPTISINAAHEGKKQINDFLSNKGSELSTTAKGFLQKAKQPLLKTLNDYSEKSPEFGKYYKLGEELHKGLQSQSKLTEFLNKYTSLHKYATTPGMKLALGLGGVGAAKYAGQIPLLAGAAAGAIGTREASRLFDLLRNSESARKHYLELVKASQNGLVNEAAKALKGLNQEYNGF